MAVRSTILWRPTRFLSAASVPDTRTLFVVPSGRTAIVRSVIVVMSAGSVDSRFSLSMPDSLGGTDLAAIVRSELTGYRTHMKQMVGPLSWSLNAGDVVTGQWINADILSGSAICWGTGSLLLGTLA